MLVFVVVVVVSCCQGNYIVTGLKYHSYIAVTIRVVTAVKVVVVVVIVYNSNIKVVFTVLAVRVVALEI